jgi:hypothetical protein
MRIVHEKVAIWSGIQKQNNFHQVVFYSLPYDVGTFIGQEEDQQKL